MAPLLGSLRLAALGRQICRRRKTFPIHRHPASKALYLYFDSTPKDCPLTWNGITVYGVIDAGAGYSSHGANFNPSYPQGVAEVIAKYSQNSKWQLVPNGLQRSNLGIKAKEEFAPGWFFVGNVNADFDPYSLRLSNGPASLVENNNKTIGNQSANSDSSRAGQFDNTQGFVGLSNKTYGTLTVGRLNSFSADAVSSYDAMEGSYAFSLIGNSATYVSGVGDTETTRYETAVKYLRCLQQFPGGGALAVRRLFDWKRVERRLPVRCGRGLWRLFV